MKWLSISNLTLGDILQWSGTAWRNTPIQQSAAASVAAVAQGGTSVTMPAGSYGVMRVDGGSILRGGATIDNTGVAGNGIKPGTAGTYLVIAEISTINNPGLWMQIGYGINGAVQKVTMAAGSAGQSGGLSADIVPLLATDVVNLMVQAASSVANYAPGSRLIVIRLW